MKRRNIVALIMMMGVSVMLLSGCATTTDPYGIERSIYRGLVWLGDRGGYSIGYDPVTKVCYMTIERGAYGLGLSPYYIIGEDGNPEIAVYGINYK